MVKASLLLSVAVPCLAKSTDSQVMLQVANLKRGGAIENMHNGVQTMQTRMESMLEEAVTSGQTPKLSDEAYQTMIDALKEIEAQLGAEKVQNDKDWVTANNKIETCNLNMKTAFTAPDGVNSYKGDAEVAEANHKKCRGEEDTLNGDETGKHGTMETTAKNAFGKKPPCPIPPQRSDETSLAFAKRVLSALQAAGTWASNWEQKVQQANAAFDKAKGLSDAKEKACDKDQGTLETEFCEYEVSLRTTCKAQEQCIKNAKADRVKAKKELTAKETAEKLILKSCSKVRCYIKLLTLGKEITKEGYETCRNQEGTYDDVAGTWNSDGPSKLNITWVDEKVEKKCDVSPVDVAPGDADWKPDRYDGLAYSQKWLSTRKQFATITPCN